MKAIVRITKNGELFQDVEIDLAKVTIETIMSHKVACENNDMVMNIIDYINE